MSDGWTWLLVLAACMLAGSYFLMMWSSDRMRKNNQAYINLLNEQRAEWMHETLRTAQKLGRLRRLTEVRMGNWRSVHIQGTCDEAEVPALHDALVMADDLSNFHCLLGDVGLAGLPNWAAPTIEAIGNLAERDFDIEDVQNTLQKLAKIAPSLAVRVHCGGDYEDKTCIATVELKDGLATIQPPGELTIPDVTEGQMLNNFMSQMLKQARQRGVE